MQKLKTILKYNTTYLLLFFFALIYSLIITLLIPHKSQYNINDTDFLCKIIDYKIDGNKLNLNLKCKENLIGTYYFSSKEEKIKYENITIGSLVKLNGTLKIPKNNTIPNLFNYKDYLNKKQIYYILNINKIDIQEIKLNIFYKLKNKIYNYVKRIKHNEYIYTYILGRNDYLNEDSLKNYRQNGISHLLALSGLHVSIFSLIFLDILKKLKLNERVRYILVFSFLLLFAFLTGFSPSILRATIMFILPYINKSLKLDIKTINLLYVTFLILILINPYFIYNLSFILSFTTTFFIILTSKNMEEKSYIKNLLKVSVISFISNIGLSIYYFGYINPVGILMNLIFVPLVSYVIFPLTLISFLFPVISNILYILTTFMEKLSNILTGLSITIYFPKINLLEVIAYYILIILFIKFKKKIIIIIIIGLLIFWKIKPILNNSYEVYFLDVGQGDSILIVSPHRRTSILIDTGGKVTYNEEKWKRKSHEYSIASDSLIPFMRSIGVNKLDYLLLTHGDQDHAGETINLINNFKINKVIFNCGSHNDLEGEIISVLNTKNIEHYSCIKEINIDNNKLYFLNTKEYNNENDNSTVIYTKLNNYKFLFMGDAGTLTEKEILNKYNLSNIDVLKVGHHGSKTSSSKEFINEIKPKYGVISVGKNNIYGHPNKEVLDNLKASKIYRTDINGIIIFKIINNTLDIKIFTP